LITKCQAVWIKTTVKQKKKRNEWDRSGRNESRMGLEGEGAAGIKIE
jgi:hypothetical protein